MLLREVLVHQIIVHQYSRFVDLHWLDIGRRLGAEHRALELGRTGESDADRRQSSTEETEPFASYAIWLHRSSKIRAALRTGTP